MRRASSIYLVGLLLWAASPAQAQLDNHHWLPTLCSSDATYVTQHCLMLSTPQEEELLVRVTDGVDELVWEGLLSKAAPIAVPLKGNSCGPHTVARNGPALDSNPCGLRDQLYKPGALHRAEDHR